MSNGAGINNNVGSIWSEILVKHGPWAIIAGVICYAFFEYHLKPTAIERTMLIETLQVASKSGTEATKAIAENTRQIAGSVYRLQSAIEDANKINKASYETITVFSESMTKTHPKQHEKLDLILQRISNGTEIHNRLGRN